MVHVYNKLLVTGVFPENVAFVKEKANNILFDVLDKCANCWNIMNETM